MATYKLSNNIRVQRDARIPADQSLKAAIIAGANSDSFDANGSFMAVSQRGKIFALNLTASLLFEQLEIGATVAQLADLLQEVYDVTPEQAKADVTTILDDLVDKKLIDII